MSAQPQAGQLAATVGANVGERQLRVVAAGVSIKEICGVRDHATLLAEALRREDVSCSLHWLRRSGRSLAAIRAEVDGWADDLAAELDEAAADAVLLHYSVFAYSYKGVPIFVGPAFAAARRARLPVVTVLHEFAYPWTRDGLTGKVWAVGQRLRLVGVINASAAALVTTGQRAAWLRSRVWLPTRPLAVAPVFSNLPPATSVERPGHESRVLGLFGYSYGETTVLTVLDALRILERRGLPVRLELLGAPGAHSVTGKRWLDLARERGLEQAPTFSGTLSPQGLSDRLAACEILLFTDPAGPTSRKTTLTASLASGRPVVGLDGPQRWPELVESEAVSVVAPNAEALAGELQTLLADDSLRETLGEHGHRFAERFGVAHSARVVARLLREVAGEWIQPAVARGGEASSHTERAL